MKTSRHWITYLTNSSTGHKVGNWVELPTTVTDAIWVDGQLIATTLDQSTHEVGLAWLEAKDTGPNSVAKTTQSLKVGTCGTSTAICKDEPKLAKAGGSLGVIWGANVPGLIQAQASFYKCLP